jgi:hypothetical protein
MKRNGTVVNKRLVKVGRRAARWGATGMNWGACPLRDAVMAASKESLKSLKALEELGKAFLEGDQNVVWWQTPSSFLILRNCPAGREQRKALNLDSFGVEWEEEE